MIRELLANREWNANVAPCHFNVNICWHEQSCLFSRDCGLWKLSWEVVWMKSSTVAEKKQYLTSVFHITSIKKPSPFFLFYEDAAYRTFPQALQWCRLSVRLKSVVQFMHIITWETGRSTGAASPRAIHSFWRACGNSVGMIPTCYSWKRSN